MKKLLLLPVLLLLAIGHSQSISKQIIGTAGGALENNDNRLSYTAGEVLVGAMTDEDGAFQLGNGYYPSLNLSVLNTETPELQLKVKVFPNPTTELIYITHPTEQFFEVRITDVNGKQILQKEHIKDQPLNVQTLTSGTYIVMVTKKDSKQTNTYKIVKQ